MKRLVYLLAVIAFFGCSSEESVKESALDMETSTLEELVHEHNETNPFHTAKYSEHKVDFGFVDNNLVIANNINGVYEDYYIINFQANEIESLKNLKDGAIEIADLGSELFLKAGSEVYYFTTLHQSANSSSIGSSKNFAVAGISKHYIEDTELARSPQDDFDHGDAFTKSRCKCISVFAYERCDAGGEGARSCSVSGCSVTCNEGYYACCNS